jgi:hypothetical protein
MLIENEKKKPSFLIPALILSLSAVPASYFAFVTLSTEQFYSLLVLLFLLTLSTSITFSIVKEHGILEFASDGLRDFFLQASILDWLTNTTFYEKNISPWMPLLMNPSYTEMIAILEQMTPDMKQAILQKGGFGKMLPYGVRQWLHPDLLKTHPQLQLPPLPTNERAAAAAAAAISSSSSISSSSFSSSNSPNSALSTATSSTSSMSFPSSKPTLKLSSASSASIFKSQITELLTLPKINQKKMWRTSVISLSLFFIMLARSKTARRTSAGLMYSLLLLGLSGTGIFTLFIGWYSKRFQNQINKNIDALLLNKRGMAAAQLILNRINKDNTKHN